MEDSEPKNPLRAPKRYKKSKKMPDDSRMMEFMSYGSSDYFNNFDQEEGESASTMDIKSRDSRMTEKRIEEWLTKQNIYRSVASEKKAIFFEEKRERIISFSFFDYLAETASTDLSPNNQNPSPMSLQFSPHNSKIYQKRSSNFSSLANLELGSASTIRTRNRKHGTYQCLSPDSKQIHQEIQEEEDSPCHPIRVITETANRTTF